MQLQLPLVVTAQVDLVLLLVSLLALWTRLSCLSYPNAVVCVCLIHSPGDPAYTHTHIHTMTDQFVLCVQVR